MTDEPEPDYSVPADKALDLLVVQPDYDDGNGPRPCVHTFRDAAFGLIFAHWGLDDVQAAIEKHGVQRSGDAAAALGYTLVVIDTQGPVFLEAQPVS